MYLIYNCYAGTVGCTEYEINNTTMQYQCYCDTDLCDATVDGPKYDAGILTPSMGQGPDGEAAQKSGSAMAGGVAGVVLAWVVMSMGFYAR